MSPFTSSAWVSLTATLLFFANNTSYELAATQMV